MIPAHERLERDASAVRRIRDRLVVEDQLAALQRADELVPQLQAVVPALLTTRLVYGDASLAPFRVGESRERLAREVGRAAARQHRRARDQIEADAVLERDARAIADLRGAGDRIVRGRGRDQERELVLPQTRHRFALTEVGLEAARELEEHLVRALGTDLGRDLTEAVDVRDQYREGLP